jgi:hypothetical protein
MPIKIPRRPIVKIIKKRRIKSEIKSAVEPRPQNLIDQVWPKKGK